jgi:Pectate lyase superfamily protein
MINVKDAPFLAVGDGSTDDRAAIQRAIDYAKNLTIAGNAAVRYRVTIYVPAGYYYISGPLDLTNTNGLWIVGDGGPYLNTIILGSTGGVMFDFSGSSLSGCENFSFITSDRNSRSTTAVLFALTSNGGLNCGIRNCYFEMNDTPAANGGFGSIGILNVRSEEFFIHDCTVRANTPIILSHRSGLAISGANFTATSPFQTLAAGTGSMGNVSINGTSLQAYEKRQPAMVLVATNSVSFQGFLARVSATQGSNETAILCVNYTTNLKVQATIESFSRALQVVSGGFEGNDIDVVVANSTAPTTEIVDVTGCVVKGFHLRVSLPVPSERPNRYVLYHAPSNDANAQVPGYILNSDVSCYDVVSNAYIISPNLLHKAVNMVFNTFQPFEKRGGRLRQLSNNVIPLSRSGATTIFRFTQADNFASTNGRGGYYRVWLDGVIRAGSYGSGGSAVLSFQAQIIINQNNTGVRDEPSATVIVLDKSVTSPTFLDIQGLIVDLTFASNIGSVTIIPRLTGTGTGEPVNYDGFAELQSDFLVNDPIPLSLS